MLDNLKILIGIPSEDNSMDTKLELIISMTSGRLRSLLGGINPPKELEYIILEVSTARFNRIGSEGLSSHSVEGESQAFSDNDFNPFMDDIKSYLDRQKDSGTGKVMFL